MPCPSADFATVLLVKIQNSGHSCPSPSQVAKVSRSRTIVRLMKKQTRSQGSVTLEPKEYSDALKAYLEKDNAD